MTERRIASAVVCVFAMLPASAAWSAPACKPNKPRPPVILKSMGPCAFDKDTLSFAGAALDQAKCLLRGMDRTRNIGPALTRLPPAFERRIGQTSSLPTREALSAHLAQQNLDLDFAAHLWRPLSRARDNDPEAPQARYFVIHDTSGPNYRNRSFPTDIDTTPKINDLRLFRCSDGWEKAHVVVNRTGAMLRGHDFSEAWRETKFERAKNFEGALKGLFLHVELIQPRRRAPGGGPRNDAQAPVPGFTAAQYERLALLYTIASVRGGVWMIPAFHAPIDSGIPGGHDDPLHFELDAFASALERLVADLERRDPALISLNP